MTEGLTKEFFDKTETDDTLQNIRKQYLASKKNLHELMQKQSTNDDAPKQSSVRIKPAQLYPPNASPLRQPVPSLSQSYSSLPADNILVLNELRSLKTIVNEQQSQINRLNNDLQTTKSLNFQLQDKVLQLQSHISYLENDMINRFSHSRLSHSMTAPSTANTTTTKNDRDPTPYSAALIEDNTTRLIQMTRPR